FRQQGSFVLLDFGKEICGGVRLITHSVSGMAKFHIRFGESITEAMTPLGTKNAGNDHSPRDFEVLVPTLSDLTFGQTGFRFVYVELCSTQPVWMQSILAVNHLPAFPFEAKIITDDPELNKIFKTAMYTVKLCCQNGYIWDGVKRDRLVWSGDLHQEILAAQYCFGNIENIPNSISFVKQDTAPEEWANWIPSYSAWWIICLCDYVENSGDLAFFREHAEYASAVLRHINSCITDDGEMVLNNTRMPYFLDWPTFGTEDAEIGTASVFLLAAHKYLLRSESEEANEIIRKLSPVIQGKKPLSKQAAAFCALAGGKNQGLAEFLESGGARGFSTFMAYYILKADAESGGEKMISLIKEYFGGMLQKGATTFWEDFDLDWMENSSRIDQFPEENQKDIHGDFGKYCYQSFRHSLCHGWSAGILAFAVEYILGLRLQGGKPVSVRPNLMGLKRVSAELLIDGKPWRFEADEEKTEYGFLPSV
ncbi:MAG: alpha-L-rhamnosidase, partial [Clostridia bacterium]|nr:alpha-L-rhamnosidase [Clostridia bacterium]